MKGNSRDTESQIKELEKELKSKESTIELIQERLKNNEDMLKDVIREKNQLKKRIHEYDLNLVDTKMSQYQKLQEDHQKTVHRQQVTKKHLDETKIKNNELNKEIQVLKKVIKDLSSRGLLDHVRGRYPESFKEYEGR